MNNNRHAVNSNVRGKLKQLRIRKKLTLRRIASRAGIPLSSYACMERGYYRINLDSLYQILHALEADIQEVWPEKKEVSTPR